MPLDGRGMRRIGQHSQRFGRHAIGRERLLDQFGHDAPACNEVRHGVRLDVDERFPQPVCQRR